MKAKNRCKVCRRRAKASVERLYNLTDPLCFAHARMISEGRIQNA